MSPRYVESKSTGGVFYQVDAEAGSCSCEAGKHGRACWHLRSILDADARRSREDTLGEAHAELSAIVDRIGHDAFRTLVAALEDEYGTTDRPADFSPYPDVEPPPATDAEVAHLFDDAPPPRLVIGIPSDPDVLRIETKEELDVAMGQGFADSTMLDDGRTVAELIDESRRAPLVALPPSTVTPDELDAMFTRAGGSKTRGG